MNDEQIPDWAKTWYYDKGFAEAEEFWRFEERERIIKLLENRPNFCSSDDESCFEWLETGDCDCKDLIALIKGENK